MTITQPSSKILIFLTNLNFYGILLHEELVIITNRLTLGQARYRSSLQMKRRIRTTITFKNIAEFFNKPTVSKIVLRSCFENEAKIPPYLFVGKKIGEIRVSFYNYHSTGQLKEIAGDWSSTGRVIEARIIDEWPHHAIYAYFPLSNKSFCDSAMELVKKITQKIPPYRLFLAPRIIQETEVYIPGDFTGWISYGEWLKRKFDNQL